MIIKEVIFPKKDEGHQKVILEKNVDGLSFNYGTVLLEAGTRFPEEGVTQHPEHEFSFLQEGKIDMLDGEGKSIGILEAGSVINIDPKEDHAGIILERCKIIYILVGKE